MVRNSSEFFGLHTNPNAKCLVHVINLATQALISTRSKAKYFTSNNKNEVLTDLGHTAFKRDEVGLFMQSL